MPTGYTADVQSGKITEFEDFVWRCARGMGALVNMRDEPWDAPIPLRFEPHTDYHDKALTRAQKRLVEIQAMDLPALREAAQQDYAAQVTSDQNYSGTCEEHRRRYDAMLARVEAWEPPTPEHHGFKAFMRQQLTESLNFDCPTKRYMPEPVKLEPRAWADLQIARAEKDLAYHTKARDEEVRRTEERNRWLSQLRESLAKTEA